MFEKLAADFAALFVIINPPAIIPVFLSITADLTPAQRRQVAFRACLIAALVLLAFLALGQIVLQAIGVDLPAFRTAGALVLLIFGLKMVMGDAAPPSAQHGGPKDVAIFPLAMPLIAGGGSIAAIVAMTDNETVPLSEQIATAFVLVVVLALVYLSLRFSDAILRILGTSGINVIGRIMGLILTALAMQILFDVLGPMLLHRA